MSMTATDFQALAGIVAAVVSDAGSEYEKQHAREVERGEIDPDDTYLNSEESQSWYEGMNEATALIALSIADYCETRNPRFDRARFLAECGLTTNHHTDEVIA